MANDHPLSLPRITGKDIRRHHVIRETLAILVIHQLEITKVHMRKRLAAIRKVGNAYHATPYLARQIHVGCSKLNEVLSLVIGSLLLSNSGK